MRDNRYNITWLDHNKLNTYVKDQWTGAYYYYDSTGGYITGSPETKAVTEQVALFIAESQPVGLWL